MLLLCGHNKSGQYEHSSSDIRFRNLGRSDAQRVSGLSELHSKTLILKKMQSRKNCIDRQFKTSLGFTERSGKEQGGRGGA